MAEWARLGHSCQGPAQQGLWHSTGASKLCLFQGFLLAGVTAALVPHLVYRSESQ